MRGILRPLGIATGILALALGGWSGAHVAAGVSPLDLTAAAQHREAPAASDASLAHASGQEPAAEPSGRPDVEPSERPDVEPSERPDVEPDEQPVGRPNPGVSSSTSTATFSLVGGTVTLSCPSSGSITVDLAAPNPGFSVRAEREDDGQTVEVRFESGSHESRLQAACAGGQVQALELREEAS